MESSGGNKHVFTELVSDKTMSLHFSEGLKNRVAGSSRKPFPTLSTNIKKILGIGT